MKSIVVTKDFPKGITPRLDCLHDREGEGGERNTDGEVRIRSVVVQREVKMLREAEKEQIVLNVQRGGGKMDFPNSITEQDDFLPCACGMQSHQYVDFSFGNSCVSLFQRYFFLIYRIPQERSVSWP